PVQRNIQGAFLQCAAGAGMSPYRPGAPEEAVSSGRHRSAQSHLQGRAMIAAYVAAGQHAFRLPGADRRIPVFLQRFTDPDASETIFKYLASRCVHMAAGLDVDARPELIRGAVAGYQAVIAQLHAAFA